VLQIVKHAFSLAPSLSHSLTASRTAPARALRVNRELT